MKKLLVAARSERGYWTPDRKWGPEPVIVEADEKLQRELAEVSKNFVIFDMTAHMQAQPRGK